MRNGSCAHLLIGKFLTLLDVNWYCFQQFPICLMLSAKFHFLWLNFELLLVFQSRLLGIDTKTLQCQGGQSYLGNLFSTVSHHTLTYSLTHPPYVITQEGILFKKTSGQLVIDMRIRNVRNTKKLQYCARFDNSVSVSGHSFL